MRNALSIEAPCKINLHLRVKGRRPDGFHELESIFLALASGDTLHFEVLQAGDADEFLVENMEELPRTNNIVLKAVNLFRAKTGFDTPVRIRLEKRIPPGAGLGGGSSDAASTLLALNELAGLALGSDALMRMAAELGSDVPFFLGSAGAAYITGRGEHIRPIEGPPDCAVLVVKPGFSSATAEAFKLLDAHRERHPAAAPLPGSPGEKAGISEQVPVEALKGPPARWPYRNDFLEVFLESGAPSERDTYRAILGGLEEAGADFCGLTGSGSACFGIFTGGGGGPAGPAEKAAKALSAPEVFTLLTFPLARLGNTVLK
ncbi:4-diphosphocytidyl-2-C-methyl-D-erythritol kinase [Spirochaetia bacterium]|nr:4-diphosphocytidyl-2-C-methyl-D-erythritol kinase [Spirochaetia bacterium]